MRYRLGLDDENSVHC